MFHAASRDFCKQANIRVPIIQAPMAGSIVSPALVAEVSKYGGLGTLPIGYLSIDDARAMIQATTEHTKQFAVNVFVPSIATQTDQSHIDKMLAHINAYRIKLGLTALSEVAPLTEPDIDKLLDMIVDEGVLMLSITFGMLSQAAMEKLRQKGVAAETIENILEDLDETELARQAIEKKLPQWRNLDLAKFRTKGIGFLSRRGFSYEVSRSVTDDAWEALQQQHNL